MSKKSKLIANLVPKMEDTKSIMQRISELAEPERSQILDETVKKYCDGDYSKLKFKWELWRRADQWFDIIPDQNWRTAAWLCGRGFGKTRTATEITRYLAENKLAKRIGIVCPTAHDANAVFLHGDSGLFNVSPPWFYPTHHPTYKNVTWPGNDTVAYLFSAEDPESLRGHQFDWMILDECAAWSKGLAVWQQVMLVNRLGAHPRAIVTTTPKANELIKAIVGNPDTWTITGSTQENSANIDIRQMVSLFEGTRLGKQELHGEILEEVEGALWKQDWIDKSRVQLRDIDKLPEFLYVVMAIDPAMTANKNSDETGICVAAYGVDDKYYILHADSYKDTPHEWAKKALAFYDDFWVQSIIVETNQGGDLVLQNLQRLRADIAVTGIHAKKGKSLRAQPVVHEYERGRVRHVGFHPRAESQMTEFNPFSNPDGKDDICLIGSTEIITDKGGIKIKDIKTDQKVLTRNGFKKVLASQMTSSCAKVYKILFDGGSLTGTSEHPVYILNKGFTKIKDLKSGDILYKCRKNETLLTSGLTESDFLDTQTLRQEAPEYTISRNGNSKNLGLSFYTEKFTDLPTKKKYEDLIFTTLTEIQRITMFQTLLNFQEASTLQNITCKTPKKKVGSYRKDIINGLELQKVLINLRMQLTESEIVKKALQKFVRTVIRSLKVFPETSRNFVPEVAAAKRGEKGTIQDILMKYETAYGAEKNSRLYEAGMYYAVPCPVLDIIELEEKEKVYNLKVEDDSEYFANGILTHNCDALSYAVLALMEKAMVNAVYRPAVGGLRHKLLNYRAR